MLWYLLSNEITASLPVRECGLKCALCAFIGSGRIVTPRAGVWIEIFDTGSQSPGPWVTPRAGVWIEIRRC